MMKKVPNYLTCARMVMVVLLLIFLALPLADWDVDLSQKVLGTEVKNLIIFIIFIVASFTDFLDGYLARKYNAVSDFGKLMDPLADKLLVNTTLLFYMSIGKIPFIVVALFIARDLLVDGLRMIALEKRIVIAASLLGKGKTIMQMLSLSILILGIGESFHLPIILISIALAISLLAMVEYYYKNFGRIRSGKVD